MWWTYLISTILLFWLRRSSSNKSSSSGSEQKPSDYTESNANQIGSAIPVVLGRGIIKNPLISYYGDFEAKPYTEEYGMHSDVDASDRWWPIVLGILLSVAIPATHPVVTSAGAGEATDTENGIKNGLIIGAVVAVLQAIMLALFNNHEGRITIQKGFLYYLGWQHIICWTGDNIGIKRIWMNVYDANLEASTSQGVWGGDSIAWKNDNQTGIVAHIDDNDMFGGYDEGGGFIGDIRVYFGTQVQGRDSWMVGQMQAPSIPQELRGLTPVYPMFMTAVIPKAYIGKQATIPDMWFEIANYPMKLSANHPDELWQAYTERIMEQWQDITNYGARQSQEVINYVSPEYNKLTQDGIDYINKGATTLDTLKQDWNDLYNKWPPSTKGEFYNVAYPLYQTFEHGPYSLGRQGDDSNPAEIIYEILTNDYWGCNYTDDKIDLISLIKVGIGCEQEEMGISCVFNQVSSCASYMTKILNHIGAMMYDDVTTGKLAFKLVRADYVVESLKRFNMSNSVSLKFTRLDWSETSSAVNASFIDAENKYDESTLTVHDFANVLITKNNVENEQDGTYFTTPQNAYNFAMRQLLSAAYPLASIELICNRLAYSVVIGEPICITWEPYGIVNQVFRITNVDFGTLTSGQIRITAVEDVYGFANTQYNYANPIAWTEPDKTPTRVTRFKFIEAPYELSMNLNTYIYAFAAKPSDDVVYWHTWRTINNEYVKTNQSQVFSMIGRTISGYTEYYGIDEQGFEIIALGYNGINLFTEKARKIENDPYTFNNKNANCLLVMDEEIMSYNSIEVLPNGNFMIKGVIRGLYDTLPKDHTTESMVYFIESPLSVSNTTPVCREGYTSTEKLGITTATVQIEQTLEPELMTTMTTIRRSESPNVMANLRFGTDNGPDTLYQYEYIPEFMLSGDLLFNFIVRNKFRDNSIRSQLDTTSIRVEENIKNYIKVVCGTDEFITYFDTTIGIGLSAGNVTDIRMLWSWFCENMVGKVKMTNYINIHVGTYNTAKNLYSIQEYVKENIKYVIPKVVGIVSSEALVQSYANSLLFYDNNSVIVPPSSVNPQIAFSRYESPIVLVGTVSNDTRYPKGQDGQHYAISNKAFRILTYQAGNVAVLGEVELKDYTVLASRFTRLEENYIQGYRYLSGEMIKYNISNS